MKGRQRYDLILVLYPNTRGFAFVVFEGPFAPVDWSVVDVRDRDKNRRCLQRIESVLAEFSPAAVVLQHMARPEARRAQRVRQLNADIEALAEAQALPVFKYSRESVLRTFARHGHFTRRHIAGLIVKHIPAFERLLPPPRKIWKSEDARMALFDATALAWLFYQIDGGPSRCDTERPAA